VTPAGCLERPDVQPGSFCGKFALLQQDYMSIILGEIAGGRGYRDPTTYNEYVGLVHKLSLCRDRTQCIASSRWPPWR
jgi:hypothetical protein